MSVYRVVKCDVCGNHIEPWERTLRVVRVSGRACKFMGDRKIRRMDICANCLHEIEKRVTDARAQKKEGAK